MTAGSSPLESYGDFTSIDSIDILNWKIEFDQQKAGMFGGNHDHPYFFDYNQLFLGVGSIYFGDSSLVCLFSHGFLSLTAFQPGVGYTQSTLIEAGSWLKLVLLMVGTR